MSSVAQAGSSTPPARTLAAFLAAAAAAAYAGFVHQFAVNVPFKDEWSMVAQDRLLSQGKLTLGSLWAQHNENRMLFPNLVMLVLDRLSHFDTRVEMYCSLGLLLTALALAAWLYLRSAGGSPLWLVPAALLVLSWAQYAVALQGFALALYLILACAAGCLVALAGSESRPWLLGLATALAVVASYSSVQGLAVWAAGLVFLIARGRRPVLCWCWSAAGAVASAIYLIGFQWSDAGGGLGWVLAHPGPSLYFLLLLPGGTVPTSRALGFGQAAQAGVGAVLLLLLLITLGRWLLHRDSGRWLALPLGLITFGVVVDLLTTAGRAHLGAVTATSSRYTFFNLWLFAGVWLGLAASYRRRRRVSVGVAVGLLLVICLAQAVGAYHAGLVNGRATQRLRRQEASLLLRYPTAPARQVRKLVGIPPPTFRSLSGYLETHRLSVFREPTP